MITLLGTGIAMVQLSLWATGRRTISHRPLPRYAVAAWALVLLGHLAYEWTADHIAKKAAGVIG